MVGDVGAAKGFVAELPIPAGVVVPVVGNLADRLETEMVEEVALRADPETANFLGLGAEVLIVAVFPLDRAELVHVSEVELELLEGLGKGVIVEGAECAHLLAPIGSRAA